jgi:hypothetical protein
MLNDLTSQPTMQAVLAARLERAHLAAARGVLLEQRAQQLIERKAVTSRLCQNSDDADAATAREKAAMAAVHAVCQAQPPHDVLATLPDELIVMINALLGIPERMAFRACCRRARAVIGMMKPDVRMRLLMAHPTAYSVKGNGVRVKWDIGTAAGKKRLHAVQILHPGTRAFPNVTAYSDNVVVYDGHHAAKIVCGAHTKTFARYVILSVATHPVLPLVIAIGSNGCGPTHNLLVWNYETDALKVAPVLPYAPLFKMHNTLRLSAHNQDTSKDLEYIFYIF